MFEQMPTSAYLANCQLQILWTPLRSQRGLLVPQTKKMTFWEIGVGLWSTANFVYNSGGSRGGAWEARAPLLFLDQTEVAPGEPKKFFGDHPPLSQGLDDRVPPPPPLRYLKVWIHHCIII